MKKAVLLIWMFLWSLIIHAEKNSGTIRFLDPGAYQIEYPNQTINIYFKYPPILGTKKLIAESSLTENEKYAIVKILKNQIDQLPVEIVEEYLNIDIFPLHILNQHEFGFYYDHQIIVEIKDIKNGMSFYSGIKSSFIHELAHHIENKQNNETAFKVLKQYLTEMYMANENSNNEINSDVYQNGFVSRYASGELTGNYEVSEEFAEIFTHLICMESRMKLIPFLESHPESMLANKINRFVDFLDENVPSLDRKYIFGAAGDFDNYSSTNHEIDGDLLLISHELRSYESFDFKVLEDSEKQFMTNHKLEESANIDYSSSEVEKSNPVSDYSVYQYYNTSDSYSQYESDQNKKNKSSKIKKKKKRKGTGLLIAGTALYIALQLMK